MENQEKFAAAIARFDELNQKDPNTRVVDGVEVAYEVFFADRMTHWVKQLQADCSDVVLLAARCQHICRWESPRNSYPEGRVGYLTWRADLKVFHAKKSGEVLLAVGYDDVTVKRVQDINLKKGLGKGEDVQVIEDALCLVFLENQYDALISKTEDSKMLVILKKTWSKMSEQGHEEALKIKYSDKGLSLIKLALNL